MPTPRKLFEGKDAWRNGFSANAADLLQIQRTFVPWTNEEFAAVLVTCAKRSKGRQTNEATVCQVLDDLMPNRARRCKHCGEPEDGGDFGWFDATDKDTHCNACGSNPLR